MCINLPSFVTVSLICSVQCSGDGCERMMGKSHKNWLKFCNHLNKPNQQEFEDLMRGLLRCQNDPFITKCFRFVQIFCCRIASVDGNLWFYIPGLGCCVMINDCENIFKLKNFYPDSSAKLLKCCFLLKLKLQIPLDSWFTDFMWSVSSGFQ